MPSESPAERKNSRGRRHSGRRCQASPHRALQTRPAPGTAAQWRVRADETPVTSAMWHDGQRQLTPPDTVCHPPHTVEWLASKCAPSSRVVEPQLPPAEGGLERGGDCSCAEAL